MIVEDQSEAIAFLAAPESHGGAAVERIDTHGTVVFLVGERAYKLKRAVYFEYMDYSSVARRHAACEAEIRVNRRTAPSLLTSCGVGATPSRRHAGDRWRGRGRW